MHYSYDGDENKALVIGCETKEVISNNCLPARISRKDGNHGEVQKVYKC